ncbi:MULTISPECIES: tRNA dihydrouridine synthase DusB [unclassified Exiguobacterium]|uniref:tRNA dihydrouridine synthase DusB n=1 Tax=unclassified Exiguobacterium TaxID=2644629 RepID=UPI00103E9AD7|nr:MULTISPECIES: tRNA dihydrouridine synthase DusB [unclassified Exiguobacterium]TCI24786.1 tRNA dihydrouridine synthase DusB [Exiguobacterium sp. SH5S4]TCI50409.1 tRNA dihydrouridine synthase DusB [Exiguobacterium sp. SH5S13]TCI59121.1 tRNA dihydrouridine synthase DusB [Exiguobacterium sp. SH3S1]
MSGFKIGNVDIKNRAVLAPMAGVTNPAFRLIAKEFGAGLVCAEMVSDKGILFENARTLRMLYVDEREKPLSLQIFGGSKDTLVKAAQYVDQNTNADIIDINMGCPVPKVTKCEAGAKWLLDPDKVYEMVNAVSKAVDKPVTVKMRTGWDSQHIYLLDNVRAAESGGAAAIAIHGRTRSQLYEGTANWELIGEAKKIAGIPIIGNGDITTPQQAKHALDHYGVDAVMIGRAALGNPWMLYQTVQYLETGELPVEPKAREKIDICMLHLDRLIDLKGEVAAVREMRQHVAWYLKGLKGNGPVRKQVFELESRDAVGSVLYDFVGQIENAPQEV